jgi:hypothetical protein
LQGKVPSHRFALRQLSLPRISRVLAFSVVADQFIRHTLSTVDISGGGAKIEMCAPSAFPHGLQRRAP